jgi:hypothetical protein
MELTITTPDEGVRAKALAKAVEAYNVRNPVLSGQEFLQMMIEQQLDSLAASYLTISIDPVEFLQRFTAQERVAIRAAAQSSPVIDDYLHMLDAAKSVNLTHDVTIAGVQALEAAELIATGRAAEILAL